MTIRLISLLYLLTLSMWSWAQDAQYTTHNPRVEDANDREVSIKRVELTERYTAIYMTFAKAGERKQSSPFQRFPFPDSPGQILNTNTINFEPGARLYANQGERSFKFIRAENIPTTQRREVQAGDVINFVVYFERLDPGVEVFDLFECSDRNRPNSVCFNFWGVHVINPKKSPPAQRPPQKKPDVSQQTPTKPKPIPPVVTPEPPVTQPTSPPIDTRPSPVELTIKGTIRDTKTKNPVGGTVAYQLLSGAERTGNRIDSVRSSGQTGYYQLMGKPLGVYAVTVSAKGYLSRQDTIVTKRTDLLYNFELTPIEAGTKITLQNIYFDQSKYDLQPESYPELNRLAQVMQENRTMKIRLEGHTDVIGDFDANLDLSRNRVKSVRQYLITKGIGADRIEAIGYGQSRPIKTGQGKPHPENRRVELVITSV